MTAFNSAAQQAAAFDLVGKRDDGVSIGVCLGVAGGVLGGLAASAKGNNVAAAAIGAAAGATVGYAVGTVTKFAEFSTTGKILSGAAAGLIGAGTAMSVSELINAFGDVGSGA